VNHPVNPFKRAVVSGTPQIGLWCSLCNSLAAEVISRSGFDWILLDTEHAPNELPDVVRQAQALSAGTAAPVVRPTWNNFVEIKRLLDAGMQNFLIPYVQTPEEAAAAVSAVRYPPQGVRGVAVTVRANHFGRVRDYYARANEEICLLLQIETRSSLDRLESIARVEGVDGLFIGPSDLAASLGHLGNPGHPEVRAAIEHAVGVMRSCGKAAGILAPVESDARHWLDKGCTVVAVGSDLGLLVKNSDQLAAKFKRQI